MSSTTTQVTAQIPSGFAMPMCGYAFDAITTETARPAMSGAGAHIGAVVRDRRGVLALGATEKSFPWTPAWRPPIS